ncbi:MAG: hypothetical protein JEZ09_12720 [Salinivirgaceae bacterium]|nr:hypothetical protein [Salinivirgaceae bacterium]
MSNVNKTQFNKISCLLLAERNAKGFWDGELSSSALSTAVSITALKINDCSEDDLKIELGIKWLLNNINSDGGFGDTAESISNISTSLLCYAAISYCGNDYSESESYLQKIKKYLSTEKIELASGSISDSILAFYGKDYTFSVPILTMLTICEVIDKDSFNRIPQLPFEFSVFPTKFYQFFNLQVVSYAIPALIAVGIAIFKNRSKGNWLIKKIRQRTINPSLKKLEKLVPLSGGFLEAIPLTAFVNLCLNYAGYSNSKTVIKGIEFLHNQQRKDGSWPIDTNLSTWVTTLAIKAFGNTVNAEFSKIEIDGLRNHLLKNQCKEVHAFNNAKSGGWGWTNYSGSVPDADDTSGAILALINLYEGTEVENQALIHGVNWLLSVQNRDGGIPTFSKGWGKLPFDASCADITGHGFLALIKSLNLLQNKLPKSLNKKWERATQRMANYLLKNQNKDGSWIALWFGNQNTPSKNNKVYGTAKVSTYLKDAMEISNSNQKLQEAINKAQLFLTHQQNSDGSFGAEKGITGTIEETALAVSALAKSEHKTCITMALAWLENEIKINGLHSSPIGLYFATLWYDEKLYPYTFYLETLRKNIS